MIQLAEDSPGAMHTCMLPAIKRSSNILLQVMDFITITNNLNIVIPQVLQCSQRTGAMGIHISWAIWELE
jgi:hypothetical protein